MSKLKADTVYKDFWRNNTRFASLFNAVVFGGIGHIEWKIWQHT